MITDPQPTSSTIWSKKLKTCDTWHVTCHTWWGMNIVPKVQLLSSYGLVLTVSWWLWTKWWLNESNNYWIKKGVCRTAPATPGLLIIWICVYAGLLILFKWCKCLRTNLHKSQTSIIQSIVKQICCKNCFFMLFFYNFRKPTIMRLTLYIWIHNYYFCALILTLFFTFTFGCKN